MSDDTCENGASLAVTEDVEDGGDGEAAVNKLVTNAMANQHTATVHLTTGCSIFIGDIQKQSPVILKSDTQEIIQPSNGYITMDFGKYIDLFCGSSITNIRTTGTDTLIKATCYEHNQLNYYEQRAHIGTSNLNSIKCDKCLSIKLQQIDGEPIRKIGFNLPGNKFATVYSVIYDKDKLSSEYASHKISNSIKVIQKPGDTKFRSTEYGTIALELYKNQRKAVCELLGLSNVRNNKCKALFGEIITRDGNEFNQYFLARGHLAPNADFVFNAQQKATYELFNAAPQWQSINNGNWKKLEVNIRKLAVDRNIQLEVHTGTLGVLQLKNSKGTPTDIYLSPTDSKMPVPKFFYKIVIDTTNKLGVVFVIANNPYFDKRETVSYTLCEDVANDMNWPKFWYENSVTGNRLADRTTDSQINKGYLYACTIEDFKKKVLNLPAPVMTLQNYALLAKKVSNTSPTTAPKKRKH